MHIDQWRSANTSSFSHRLSATEITVVLVLKKRGRGQKRQRMSAIEAHLSFFFFKKNFLPKFISRSRNVVAFCPAQKKLIKQYRNQQNATSVYYVDRASSTFRLPVIQPYNLLDE